MNTTTTSPPPSTLEPPPPSPSPMSDPLPHSSQDTTTNTTNTFPSPPTTEVINLRPPSKLPSRPRKQRKLSPETTDSSINPKSINTTTTLTTTSNDKIVPRRRVTPAVPLPRSLSSEGEVETAIKHLRTADPMLAKLIDLYNTPSFDSSQTPFLALAKSILYQQLAYKAGSSIYSRFVSLCGGESAVTTETVLSMTSQQLRQIGVSSRKTEYLHDLARKYQNGILSDSSITNMDDKSLFTMLTMVNGIGSWSVHMFMIFSLHRPDCLPVNDLGIRKGVQALYGLKELPRPSQMEQLCEKWRPYRSVACWYIWRFMEANNGTTTSVVNPLITVNPLINVPATGLSLQQQERQVLPLPTTSTHQQSEHQQQFVDPVNGIINLGQ